ncbi:hypothetical protein FBUS_09751, partial [Fasciolopsis buskii]
QEQDEWIRPSVTIRWNQVDYFTHKNRSLLVFLQNNQGVRQFPLQHAITASHLFTLISNMHFYQATAELCAPHAAGLLEKIGMFNCEINILTELAMQTNITLFSMQMRCTK